MYCFEAKYTNMMTCEERGCTIYVDTIGLTIHGNVDLYAWKVAVKSAMQGLKDDEILGTIEFIYC